MFNASNLKMTCKNITFGTVNKTLQNHMSIDLWFTHLISYFYIFIVRDIIFIFYDLINVTILARNRYQIEVSKAY
jgi:hypothetical protein